MGGIIGPDTPREYPSIILQTRLGTMIPNSQDPTLSELDRRIALDLRAKYVGGDFRTGPIPRYNCHGLTFASRRTRVHDVSSIQSILKDDGYEEVDPRDVVPGDIVIYFSEMGAADHSGIVMEVPKIEPRTIRVLSKWGTGPEVVHALRACPYEPSQLRYYRIRS